MANLSAGDTVKPTNSNKSTTNGNLSTADAEDTFLRSPCTRRERRFDASTVDVEDEFSRSPCTRRKRRSDASSANREVPEKTQRCDEPPQDEAHVFTRDSCPLYSEDREHEATEEIRVTGGVEDLCGAGTGTGRGTRSSEARDHEKNDETRENEFYDDEWSSTRTASKKRRRQQEQFQASVHHQHHQQNTTPLQREDANSTRRAAAASAASNARRDEATKLRKTIQWLEEGARRLREDLASVRTELHEERRAGKIARRETDAAIREARAAEAAKYQLIIADLKTRLSRFTATDAACRTPSPSASSRMELMKEENHRREVSTMKKRLEEADKTIRRLKWDSLNLQAKTTCRVGGTSCVEVRRLETEVRNVRASNEKLEEKLRVATDAEKARASELRTQHENHEVELSRLRKSFRSETIKMMDQLRAKDRDIEKLSSKLTRSPDATARKSRKASSSPKDEKDDVVTMRKLRESDRNGSTIRPISRTEKKFFAGDIHAVDAYIRELSCDGDVTEVEVERLRELALEQQDIIEILRQALKEKERKLEQLSNKRRKEEFYRQWLELEPVAEVEDEEDHEEGDSALSSAPSSLSPQPGGCGQWSQGNGVNREAYEAVLIEVEELQTKLLDERQELSHAKGQVRDLEKALLQETRCSGKNIKELNTLNDKIREVEEREATVLVELSELREQNELLEFRLLELEESSARRESPDHTADSGIVSPEPMHHISCKDQVNRQRNRAVATVIPYTTTVSNLRPVSPIPRKPPLSLQESGIFEGDDDDENDEDPDHDLEVELTSRGTQTDLPAGELLQEVQRLQELRARIQERAAKVTTPNLSITPNDVSSRLAPPFGPSLEVVVTSDVDSIVQSSSYQDRIRDLQERLETYAVTEEQRNEERQLSKQREEELLDENYRLTERLYWLENELRNVEEPMLSDGLEVEMTREEEEDEEEEEEHEETSAEESNSAQIVEERMLNDNEKCDPKDLENRCECEEANWVVEQMRHVEEEESKASESRTVSHCARAAQTTDDLLEALAQTTTSCSLCGGGRSMAKNNEVAAQGSAPPSPVTVEGLRSTTGQGVEEVAEEAREDGEHIDEEEVTEVTMDEVDGSEEECSGVATVPSVSQVLVVAEEERPVGAHADPVVTFSETESEKKVIYFRWR